MREISQILVAWLDKIQLSAYLCHASTKFSLKLLINLMKSTATWCVSSFEGLLMIYLFNSN